MDVRNYCRTNLINVLLLIPMHSPLYWKKIRCFIRKLQLVYYRAIGPAINMNRPLIAISFKQRPSWPWKQNKAVLTFYLLAEKCPDTRKKSRNGKIRICLHVFFLCIPKLCIWEVLGWKNLWTCIKDFRRILGDLTSQQRLVTASG